MARGDRIKLTARIIEEMQAPAKGLAFLWDSEIPGLGVRCTEKGVKSFVLRYVPKGGRRDRLATLERVDLKFRPLSVVRESAGQAKARVTAGADPLDELAAQRKAPTVGELCEEYLESHAKPKKRASSVENDTRMIEKVIKNEIGNMKVADVTSKHITDIHNKLRATPYHANRVLALLSKMFSLSIGWKYRIDNPCKGVEKFNEERRERWLSVDEMAALFKAMGASKNTRTVNAIKLILFTGSRIDEVLSATWDMFDLEAGKWIKPSAHTKQKKTEHVPLSEPALKLLKGIKASAVEGVKWVFPGDANIFRREGDKRIDTGEPNHLQEIKREWASLCKTAKITNCRPYDLRHTFASHLVSNGESLEIIGKLMGHTQAQTTRRYAHVADEAQRAVTSRFAGIVEAAEKKKVGAANGGK